MIKSHCCEVLEKLCQFDSPTIANVIELFGVRPRNAGYMTTAIKAIFPQLPPVVGYASTATFRSAYPANHKDSYMRLAEQVEKMQELPSPRFVVFQDLDSPLTAATIGEVMATTYRRFGAVGLITSGAARDILQIQSMNFPVFSAEISVSHGYSHIEEIHVPIYVGGLQIRPGDLLHADANGIVLIPHDIVDDIAGVCDEFVDAEQIVLDYLAKPDATPQGFKEVLPGMKNGIQVIEKRVMRK